MGEEILEEGVLIGNPIDGWERVVKKMQVKGTEGNKVMIQKGHGLTDISCRHGSRWIWNPLCTPEPCWMQVVYAPGCDCGAPPKPYNRESLEWKRVGKKWMKKKYATYVVMK